MKKVIVASRNPVKINAVKTGFEKIFKDNQFEFIGSDAKSEVSDQPMTDQETLQGALNRVKNARLAAPEADFWAGLEGGTEEMEDNMYTAAWIIIESKGGLVGRARTTKFIVPPKIADLVRQGMELGQADDIVFKQENSKQKMGGPGLLTKGAIDREAVYVHAVILACIPFINEELF